ncbi:MAG TPA: Ig-like domain-containing protein, partial [Prolixibacteraceae bacterium]|nr:Ig-like domain-containing protein [Prolixibacteraceae bacterium]
MMRAGWALLFFCTGIFLAVNSTAEELPRGTTDNCFYIMPLFERVRVPGSLSMEDKRIQFLKMKEQLGYGNLYHRLGFSFIYGPNADAEVRQNCLLAQEYGVHLGLIFALQSHTREDFRTVAAKDLRLFQWRKDGNDWKGSFTSSGTVEVPEDQRDYKIPTPSRYATPLREYNAIQAVAWSESVKKLMADFPGVVTCINGPIEEELAIGGMNNPDKLADYSPFAITEFRDWLRHAGLYDASSGKFAGEGASKLLIGELVDFNGTLRSQFYDDQTPADGNGTGVSFNQFFGTGFSTWSLKYWDLDIYPDAITDVGFDCTPEAGKGFWTGGFDAPRVMDANSKFWKAWSYDIPDQGGNYPPGNPGSPAFGFRQNLTRNLVRDLFEVVASSGLPRELMFAHQIPAEALANFTGAGPRNRSSASTIWSGYLEKSKTVGITRFGDINPELMTQYAGDWGIFEWHTLPNADPGTAALYNTSMAALGNYYRNKVHYLYPGWWSKDSPDNSSIFPLNDSKFAEAIRDFMVARTEVPYKLQGAAIDYSPPRVTGISGNISEDGTLNLKWNDRIWKNLLQRWGDWKQFAHFEVQWSADGTTWSVSEKTTLPLFTKSITGTSCEVRIRAVSNKGLTGVWSENFHVVSQPESSGLLIVPEYKKLFADPEMYNNITISMGDPGLILDPASLSVAINGEGKFFNTAPENAGSAEKFWPMNSPSELTGIYRLDNVVCAGGLLDATVSPVTPVDPYFSLSGSSLDGTKLRYISFRLYSDVQSGGQLFWFIAGGNKSITFPIVKGWNVYAFSDIPDWISQSAINSVRLDPGTTASAKIAVDWFAISSKPVSANLVPSFTVSGNQANLLTAPTATPGSYTVTATMNNLTAATTVQTSAVNQKPVVSILSPSKDTTVVSGKMIRLIAEAKDPDGKVDYVNYLLNNTLIQKIAAAPYILDWAPSYGGNFQLVAEAFDNAGGRVQSEVKKLAVVEPKPFSASNVAVPGLLEAENYDDGGENISFHDLDLLNKGGLYRSDPVDIWKKTDNMHGYFVGMAVAGEWLSYTIEVKKAGKVDIHLQ